MVTGLNKRALTKIQAAVILVLIAASTAAAAYVASGHIGGVPSGPVSITDMNGRTVQLPETVERAIILNSYWTEIACAIGTADKIVGVSKDVAPSAFIPDSVRNLTNVGSLFAGINMEAVIALDPDVVIMDFGYGKTTEIVQSLENLNISVVCLFASSFQDLLNATLLIGKTLGAEQKAQELVSFMTTTHSSITSIANSIPAEAKPEVLICDMSVWGQGLVYTYVNTSWGQIIVDVGGINVAIEEFGNSSWVKINIEKVLAWDPDTIVMLGRENATLTSQLDSLNSTVWGQLTAVKEGRVYGVLIGAKEKGCYLDWTPRVLIGESIVAKLVYPTYFSSIDVSAIKDTLTSEYYNMTL
jgi:iron complex transport system substrate-binding protein